MTKEELLACLPFKPMKGAPRPNELLWLYNFVAQHKPCRILEGGAGSTTAVMRLAAPEAKIHAVEAAPKGSDWAKNMDLLRSLVIHESTPATLTSWLNSLTVITPLYPNPLACELFDFYFLDSSAGIFVDGGAHHCRTQCLFLGLACCRRDAIVVFHDAKRKSKEIRGVLAGLGSMMESAGQMEAWRLNLMWDLNTGKKI